VTPEYAPHLSWNRKCDHKVGDRQELGCLPINPLLAIMMLAMRATAMSAGMGNPDCRCTGLALKQHVIAAFPPATPHRPKSLMVAGQHFMPMARFQIFLVAIDQL